MKFRHYIFKRKIENVLMFPFILIGRLLALANPLKQQYDVFFFFPFYHTGGAEKVHAQITRAMKDKSCIIFFTRRSSDERFLREFKASGATLKDISPYIDSVWLYPLKFIWRGKISGYINRQPKAPVVFNGQSNFGYKISPWIRTGIRQVELIHSFNTFSWIRIPFIPFISETVMISQRRIAEHQAQYQRLGIPATYASRIRFVQNAIDLPISPCPQKDSGQLRLLFVGRGTPEKRPELFIEIARKSPTLQCTLVGDMPASVTEHLPGNVEATGGIDDINKLHEIYCRHHVLIIPSSTEGFPIVLMEAMARGCAVVATPVGDIPDHINEQNGHLLSTTDASVVVSETVAWLKALTPEKIRDMAPAATAYAFKNFGIEEFNRQYQYILQP